MINQLSVFLENAKGRLSQITRVLADANIDFLALTIADTTNFGILRTIVSDEETAVSVLKAHGYAVSVNQVLAVVVADHPGGLGEVLDILTKADISIEYLYSFVRKPKENALMIFKVDDVPGAIEALKANNVPLLNRSDLE